MLMPYVFGEGLFDNLMNDFALPAFYGANRELCERDAAGPMRTDVREVEGGYILDVDLPGFKKDDITIRLENGYLIISAAKEINRDENDGCGKYMRRERWAGRVSRRFHVGPSVREEDIHPRYADGVLTISLPKAQKRAAQEKRCIPIED